MTDRVPESYEKAVEYIEELPRFTQKHTLEHTRAFLRCLGNPGLDRRIIHVAGTNGKGSVCAYIQAILEAEGKRTGFFTSPHLVKINERIQLGREPVSDETFYKAFLKTHEAVKEMERTGLSHPSYFEFLFGMGMCVFGESDAEYIILETGLGGRLDATNAPMHPFLTVITSISLDHTDILGDTIEEIAAEKAGIIKEGVPVIFDGSDARAAEVICRIAADKQAPCREITNRAFEIQEVDRNHIAFFRKNAYDKDTMWSVPGCGIYQVMNAELAVCAMEEALMGEPIHKDRWVTAVRSMNWEGRMELVAPHFTVDGAHNPGALFGFAESLRGISGRGGEISLPVLIFSAVSDKKYEQMIEFLCREVKAKAYIVTEIEDRRGVAAGELSRLFEKYTKQPVYQREKLNEAIELAYSLRGESEIYCLGSLYLVGMVKKYLQGGASDVRF